jgi:hypothetical protein
MVGLGWAGKLLNLLGKIDVTGVLTAAQRANKKHSAVERVQGQTDAAFGNASE